MDLISMFMEYKGYFLAGVQYTLLLAAISVVCGFFLGLIIALLRMSPWWIVRFLGHAWVEFLRGTPMMVQLLIIHYGLAFVFDINFSPIQSGAITLSINSSAYLAEIFRAGIQGVDRGQGEAARSLGMTKGMAMRHIIIPQAIKSVLPAIGNEFITIIKESSIVSIIGTTELIFQAQSVVTITYDGMKPYLIIAIMYFILTFTLSRILGVFERKLKTSDHR
ncbi:amino acid ABC transporter permease [Paenibacillus macerans]|uniref:amino acid ABC transporter permease n=1 Tax=Paenibacillus macerans TaxID=44252 RepID=UPI00204141A1|nr:amino acid ABC transporter permease [Paenibacillus macerans]MCM3702700.1 amino acid ABC transporter permease [Paenibacillus macerans]